MFHSVTLLSQAPLARGYRALLSVLLFMYSGQSCNGIQGDFRRMMNSRPLVALPQSLNLVSKMRTSIEGLETLRFCTGNEVLSCPGCKERNIKGSHGVNSSVFKKSHYFVMYAWSVLWLYIPHLQVLHPLLLSVSSNFFKAVICKWCLI